MNHNGRVLRITIIMFLFCMLFILDYSVVKAETYGDYTYELLEDGESVRITGYNGSEAKIVIPSTIEELPVTSIGNMTSGLACWRLRDVTIPEGVISIENNAFKDGTLTKVSMPDSLLTIGNSAFSGCSSITSITIPDNVTSIGNAAFSGCSSITSITIPDNVTSIGADVFDGCSRWLIIYANEGTVAAECVKNAGYTVMPIINWSSLDETLKVPGTSEEGNIITNSLFEYELHGWGLDQTVPYEKNKYAGLNIYATDIGTEPWEPQLAKGELSLTAGNRYKVSVDLVSFVDRSVVVALEDWADGQQEEVAYEEVDGEVVEVIKSVVPTYGSKIQKLEANKRTTISFTTDIVAPSTDYGKLYIGLGNVTGNDSPSIFTIYSVNVVPIPVEEDEILVAEIVPEEAEISLETSTTQILNISVFPKDAANTGLRYSSKNKYIASVSDDGIVMGTGEGTTQIIVTAADGSGVTASVTVNVTASEEDSVAATEVDEMIMTIGTVTLQSAENIESVRNSYDALTSNQKRLVKNYKILKEAESTLAELNEAEEQARNEMAAKPVDDLITAIGTVTLSSETAILNARTAYDALTDEQKELVTSYDVLVRR